MQTLQKHRSATPDNKMRRFYIAEKIQRTLQQFLQRQIEVAFETRNTMQNIVKPAHR
jgi:hypothetical protein